MRWFLLALLGIVIAAGISVAASGLASQQIGLASQPISAGDALAPGQSAGSKRPSAHDGHPHITHAPGHPTGRTTPTPQPEPSSEATAPAPAIPASPAESSHEGDGGSADD